MLSSAVKDRWLLHSADLLEKHSASIIQANQSDLQLAPQYGLTDAAIDRLKLNDKRIKDIADALAKSPRFLIQSAKF